MENILKRVDRFSGKLYIEFGGKLFDDLHASRVLPGFKPDAKVAVLKKLEDKLEIVMVVASHDIDRKRIRADYGTTYDSEVIRQIGRLRAMGLYVGSVVVTMYKGQKSVDTFVRRLKEMGERVYIHRPTEGYPDNVDLIVSEKGYGANPYIKTTRPIVVVTAPGPGSGKMATCLSQLYHESKKGAPSGYAKYETFPIWNLPVNHPVNLAYEASTAELNDKNMVDPFYKQAYGKKATNYNRDIESFPILNQILTKIWGEQLYKSPTDMGVNMAGFAITDDEGCKEAGYKEITRRYFRAMCDAKLGKAEDSAAKTIAQIISRHKAEIPVRKVEAAAADAAKKSGMPCVAIELGDGTIICQGATKFLSCSAAAVLDALKQLAGQSSKTQLISTQILENLVKLKNSVEGTADATLGVMEMLSALSICSAADKNAAKANTKLTELICCEAHSSHILPNADYNALKGLRLNISCQPVAY